MEKINKISVELFNKSYPYFSFNVASLFTNILLSKTINVIIDRVYKGNISNKVKRNMLNKLINHCCDKTVFCFSNVIHNQRDVNSLPYSLGHIFANVVMTKPEKKILQSLIESGKLKFYMRHLDDILLLAKEDDKKCIFDKFNSFRKKMKLTMDLFEENNLHFLNITISKTGNDLYYKPTHTGQYTDFNCSVSWDYKILLISNLYFDLYRSLLQINVSVNIRLMVD